MIAERVALILSQPRRIQRLVALRAAQAILVPRPPDRLDLAYTISVRSFRCTEIRSHLLSKVHSLSALPAHRIPTRAAPRLAGRRRRHW